MLPIYLVCAIAAVVLSSVALIPALIVAGVACVLVFHDELLTLGGKMAGIRAPRPKTAVVRQSPVEAKKAGVRA